MAHLNESVFVACPYRRAREYLAMEIEQRVESRRAWTLRAPLAGVELKKDVVVTLGPGIDPMHMDQPWHVHWTPQDGGPYPDFDGELTVRADEDYTTSILELSGEYCPPGGAAGRAFDVVAGSRIATLTARALLEQLQSEFESHHRAEENAKP